MVRDQYPSQANSYEERFFGAIPLVVIAAVEAIVILSFIDNLILLGICSLILTFLVLTSLFLVVKVESKRLIIVYGVGLYDRVISPSDIIKIDIIENKSLFSWLYNPLGTQCLAIGLRNSRTIYLPSKQPKKIIDLLKR